jgi:MFS family permease
MRDTTSLKFMVLLGMPAFGLTFGVTILTAFLPQILHSLISPVLIGLIIGAEGFFGLFIPLIFGVLADRSKTVGGRWKYLVPATVAMAAALVLMGIFNNIAIISTMVALFYFGYFAYLAPYWATYPDLIPKDYAGRSRSAESSWRVAGAFIALVSGGFLLALWKPLAFVISAGLIGLVTFIFGLTIAHHSKRKINSYHDTMKGTLKGIWQSLSRHHDIRNLLIANAFWNGALQTIQAFTVLFFTQGMHRSAQFVSGVIFPIAAIGILAMAPLAGKLADKYGHYKVLVIATVIYAAGSFAPTITQSYWVVIAIPLVAGAAATLMTLPYSALMRLITNQPHGAISGLFGISRGIGTFAGPVIAGAAIQLTRHIFKNTNGYAGMWLAVGVFLVLSLPFLQRLRRAQI